MAVHPSDIEWQDGPVPNAELHSHKARLLVWLEYQLHCLYQDVGKLKKITTLKTLHDKKWHEVDTLVAINPEHIKFWAWIDNT